MNSEDVLARCSSEGYIVRHTKRKGIKEYKTRKTIFPHFKTDPRSFLQVFSYINHFLPIYYSLYSYNLYRFVFVLFSAKLKQNMAITVVLDSV
jgi:hypothetical protein